MLGKQFEKLQYLQIFLALVQGKIVNLICYEYPEIRGIYPRSYWGKWFFVLVGIFHCSYGVAMLFQAELVKNPFEELTMIISRKIHIEFRSFRMYIDILFMLLSLLMILYFRLDYTTVREGTWASMMLLGKSMKYTFPIAERTSFHHRKMQAMKSFNQ